MKKHFSQKLIHWYQSNKRKLPWRGSKSPYKIWLSEIILQQTQIKQGTPYFLKFIEQYPTIHDLAKAPEDEVLKHWQGLGYYSRARNMLHAARHIVYDLNSVFPNSYKDLLKLKGVGDYTASIVASICFDEVAPCVDGNVYRFLSRYFDVDLPTPSTTALKHLKNIIYDYFSTNNPGDFNQALMEFGALHCTPKNPKCGICPFTDNCKSLKNNTIDSRPVKVSKKKPRNRFFNYLVYIDPEKNTLFEQRKENDIWKGLYQFPLIETKKDIINSNELSIEEDVQNKILSIKSFYTEPLIHKLSHQKIEAQFWIIYLTQKLEMKDSKNALNKLAQKPTSKLTEIFLSDFLKQL